MTSQQKAWGLGHMKPNPMGQKLLFQEALQERLGCQSWRQDGKLRQDMVVTGQ